MGPQDLAFFVLVGLAVWLLLIRPQRARAKSMQEMRSGMTIGSRVMTTAGLHATVTALADETVVLEIADGVQATFATAAVVRVLTPAVPEQAAPPAD